MQSERSLDIHKSTTLLPRLDTRSRNKEMESPQPKRVRKEENSPAPADVKNDLLTASKTLEEIGQLIKDQQVELMASLRSLSAHHEEILQDHNEYGRKLAYHKERYQNLSFLCSVTDYMILRLIAATNHFGLILPDKKMTEKDVKK